jgi:uncharacterized metal-binding protein YceD (DUF177 family)
MTKEPEPSTEFSRPVAVAGLAKPTELRIRAEPAERAALARRFGLLAIDRLEAAVRLAPVAAGIRLEASLSAAVVQECVVTLESVPAELDEDFAIVYGEAAAEDALLECGLGEDDDFEPLAGGEIDVGEAVAQQLSLALDPYPRAAGAALPGTGDAPAEVEHPFAALAKLKNIR